MESLHHYKISTEISPSCIGKWPAPLRLGNAFQGIPMKGLMKPDKSIPEFATDLALKYTGKALNLGLNLAHLRPNLFKICPIIANPQWIWAEFSAFLREANSGANS